MKWNRNRAFTVIDEFREKNNKERRNEIVNSLHVTTGWVTNRPNEENPFEQFLHDKLLKDWHQRIHPRNVDVDLNRS
jgi:hypothetical protein